MFAKTTYGLGGPGGTHLTRERELPPGLFFASFLVGARKEGPRQGPEVHPYIRVRKTDCHTSDIGHWFAMTLKTKQSDKLEFELFCKIT